MGRSMASRVVVRSMAAMATAWCFVGCGSQVIPGVVVEGTTATIALPFDMDIGYGRTWAGTASDAQPTFSPSSWNPIEDLQRGEMIFHLYTNAVPTVGEV